MKIMIFDTYLKEREELLSEFFKKRRVKVELMEFELLGEKILNDAIVGILKTIIVMNILDEEKNLNNN